MDIILEDIRFRNTALNEPIGEATSWPYANIGDVETVEIDFRYDGSYLITTSLVANDGNTVVILNPDINLTDVARDERILWTDQADGFADFEEGDEVTIDRFTGGDIVKTIVEKINDQTLLMDSVYVPIGGGGVILEVDSKIYVSTKIESLEFYHNWIENDEPINFEDLTTGIVRKARVEGLSNIVLTETSMTQLGGDPYKYGTLSVRGNGIGDGNINSAFSQAFTITHTTLVAPLSTPDEVDNEKLSISPSYLIDDASLKYVYQIEASLDLTNPNKKRTVINSDIQGNIGDVGENGNTGLTDYFVENVVYTKLDGTVIDSLELTTNEQFVDFDLRNTTASPFSSGNTRVIMSHWFMHTSEEEIRLPEFPEQGKEYPSRDRTLLQNALFDRAECVLDTITTAPDNLGTDYQIIKQVDPVYISNNKIHVRVSVQKALAAVGRISLLTDQNYRLTMSTKNWNKTRAKSDKTNVEIDVNTYFTDVTDPSMITFVNSFLDHPNSDVDTGTESLIVRTNDDILGISRITLNRNDITDFQRQGITIGLHEIKMQAIIRKDADTYFVADEFVTSIDFEDIVNDATYGSIPLLDITQNVGYLTPADELRKNASLQRRPDLDGGGLFVYELRFPFSYRDNDFEENTNVNDEFFDLTKKFNGKNQEWSRFFAAGWSLQFRVEVRASKDGLILAPYVSESALITEDYDAGTEWDRLDTKTYKTSNGDEIQIGGSWGIMNDQNTLIEADMLFNTTPLPSLNDLVFRVGIAVFEGENFKSMHYYSSLYQIVDNNIFLSTDNSNLITKSIVTTTTFRASVIVKPPSPSETYHFIWRYFDLRADLGVPDGKTMVDGTLKRSINGIIKEII